MKLLVFLNFALYLVIICLVFAALPIHDSLISNIALKPTLEDPDINSKARYCGLKSNWDFYFIVQLQYVVHPQVLNLSCC